MAADVELFIKTSRIKKISRKEQKGVKYFIKRVAALSVQLLHQVHIREFFLSSFHSPASANFLFCQL